MLKVIPLIRHNTAQADHVLPVGFQRLKNDNEVKGYKNYIIGNDPLHWHAQF